MGQEKTEEEDKTTLTVNMIIQKHKKSKEWIITAATNTMATSEQTEKGHK